MRYLLIALLTLSLLGSACWAADTPQLRDEKDKINYSVGYQVGGDLKREGVELNAEALVQGVRDAFASSAKPLLGDKEMESVLVELKKKIDAHQEGQGQKKVVENYPGEGREFLAANAKKKGVISLPSGLQYMVLKEGSGKMPKAGDTVTVNYRGTEINGQEFDSSFRAKKPATFPLTNVIPGWKEALPMMREGAKWRLFIPADLAFGERGPMAEKTVIYEIELLSVQPAKGK